MNENAKAVPFDLEKIKTQVIGVITRPDSFFRAMAKGGGFQDPLIFLLVISLVVGLIRALSVITTSFFMAVGVLIFTPVMVAIFGFVGAAIVYVVWNIMGSKENYETAYRCMAYASAIAPITTLISFVPYLGGLAATAWGFYLLYVASVAVHHIPEKKAQKIWGILFVIVALFGVMSEVGTRKAQKAIDRWEQRVQSGEMTPEDAGKLVGEFLIGLEKAAQKQHDNQREQK